MENGIASADPYIRVDVDSLTEAARFVAGLGESLCGATGQAQRHAQAGLAAIPPSDLFEAYAFCWGRWSAVLDAAHRAMSGAGDAMGAGSTLFQRVDHQAARGIQETAG